MSDKPPIYTCPKCKTKIPFGPPDKPPPRHCPGCNKRLWIPTYGWPAWLILKSPDEAEPPKHQYHRGLSLPDRKMKLLFSAIAIYMAIVGVAVLVLLFLRPVSK